MYECVSGPNIISYLSEISAMQYEKRWARFPLHPYRSET